jgi:HAD superfamily hydrolase (TIGR01509 family)
MVVSRFKLKRYFDAIVSAEEVGSRGKPAPDIYLWTANKLDIQPADCLVVEDSTNGILSAKAAGMKVVGYRTKDNQGQDLSRADKIVRDLFVVL